MKINNIFEKVLTIKRDTMNEEQAYEIWSKIMRLYERFDGGDLVTHKRAFKMLIMIEHRH